MKKIKAILCDWDDTKVATFSSVSEVYASFATKENIPVPSQEVMKLHWGKPMKMYLQSLWPMINQNRIEEKFWSHIQTIDFAVKPFIYTRSTVLQLKEKGYILGVISAGPKKGMEDTLRKYMQFSVNPYAFFFSGDDTEYHKPDPRVFDKAAKILETLGIIIEDTMYIGDSLIDYKAAMSKGITFVAVTTGFTTKEDFIRNGLDENYVINNFGELPTYLEKGIAYK